MSRFADIDLALLPPPPAVERLDYEALLAARLAEVRRLWPAYDVGALETDPIAIIQQAAAYRELVMRARVNDAVQAVMLATATGGDLDQLAAYLGVSRAVRQPASDNAPAVMESDDRLRMRTQLALEAFSTAGPEGAYAFHAYAAHPGVKDVAVYNPREVDPGHQDGHVHVVLLSDEGSGMPTPAMIRAVTQRLTAEDVRPLTDKVSVRPALLREVMVTATIVVPPGPDVGVVRAEAMAAFLAYRQRCHRIGGVAAVSGLYDALHLPIATRVALAAPTADVTVGRHEAPWLAGLQLTIEVADG
jgi:phage-related baseplate assembly protein